NLTLKAVRVNPATGIDLGGLNQAGSYLISYNQSFATGTVRIYGDYTVSGSTFTLDYGTETYSGAGDANIQKFLLFGPSSSTFNKGRSKIEIAPGSGLRAVGVSTAPTLVTMMGGATYYSFVDSGAFTAQYASFTNVDENGLWLNGSGPFSIKRSTFDTPGSGVG